MSSVSTNVQGGIGHRARILVLGALVACLGTFAFAGQAKAAPGPLDMTITNGQLDLGAAFAGATILPAPDNIDGTPLPDVWSPGDPNPPFLKLLGTYDPANGEVVIPPGGFQSPIMQVTSPIDGSPVPIMLQSQTPNTANFSSLTPVTGNYDPATGEMNLDGTWSSHVLVALGMGNVTSTCEVPLPGLSLSTADNSNFTGTEFTSGITGPGALTGQFTITADSNEHALPPGTCADVNTATKGAGGIWLANGKTEPDPFPVCPEGTEGVPPNCTPIPPPVQPGKVKKVVLKLKNKKLKAGKSTKMNVIVYNGGGQNLTAKVTLKAKNKNVKLAKKKVTIKNIKPGKNKQVKVKITAKKGKKGKKTAITAKSGGKTGRLKVKIK